MFSKIIARKYSKTESKEYKNIKKILNFKVLRTRIKVIIFEILIHPYNLNNLITLK